MTDVKGRTMATGNLTKKFWWRMERKLIEKGGGVEEENIQRIQLKDISTDLPVPMTGALGWREGNHFSKGNNTATQRPLFQKNTEWGRLYALLLVFPYST